ncbi:MAG: hypothetical protein KatS3mg058_4664 [Roseiflexus sp.]|nr:MAG: hypothetical protein KatS3mg058_4664 [Roseiflexus sp.]
MRDKSRATPLSGPSRAPRLSPHSPRHKCEIHLARRHCRDPRARLATNARYISRDAIAGTLARASPLTPLTSPQMRDKSRATPLSGPSRAPLAARHKCEIHLARRHCRDPRARLASHLSPLAPLASPRAPRHKCEINLARRRCRDPRARLASHPTHLATNARYISRDAIAGTLARASPLTPLTSPQMRDTSRATPLPGPSRAPRLSPHSPRHKCEINLALRRCRDPRARLSPLATNARYISRDAIAGTLARASPLTSRRSPRLPRLAPLATNARYISRYAVVGTLARASRLSPLATNARYISRDAMVGTLSRASPQMRDKSRATPWSGHLAPLTSAPHQPSN